MPFVNHLDVIGKIVFPPSSERPLMCVLWFNNMHLNQSENVTLYLHQCTA